jgi:hypothetical protein
LGWVIRRLKYQSNDGKTKNRIKYSLHGFPPIRL